MSSTTIFLVGSVVLVLAGVGIYLATQGSSVPDGDVIMCKGGKYDAAIAKSKRGKYYGYTWDGYVKAGQPKYTESTVCDTLKWGVGEPQ